VIESAERVKKKRNELIAELRLRDGDRCMYPDCPEILDFSVISGPKEVTIDHHMPQSKAYEMGWTYEEVWDLSNLRLMTKRCNAKKGSLIPNEDGTLPERALRTFRYRRDKRSQRPEVCTECNSGRNLGEGEWCNACGSGPMPERYPRYAQASPKECDHDVFHCVSCTVYFPEKRRQVANAILTGGPGYE